MDSLVARGQFDTLRHCIYLNQASLGLIPRDSTEAMVRFLVDVAQHGNVRMSDAAEAGVLDELRSAAATLLDAPLGSIAIVGGASEGLGQVASMLATREGEVLLVPTDFPSVTYPWLGAQDRLGMRIRWVSDLPHKDLTASLVDAIADSTSVVCVSAVQYATGTLVDVGAVVTRAHEAGARVVVDVTQMAGAAPVSMRGWSADALVCSGYKWLSAPGGVAILAVGEDLAETTPHIIGWKGTENPFDFRPQTLALAHSARRFELSTMAYSSAVGLSASLALLTRTGLPAIAGHARSLAKELVSQAETLGWAPFRPMDTPAASSHIVSLRHPTLPPDEIQTLLAKDHQIVVSSRGGGIRVSLHGYNESTDIKMLAEALATIGPTF
jgi:cysteine desulfurase/selenocysteine lyase